MSILGCVKTKTAQMPSRRDVPNIEIRSGSTTCHRTFQLVGLNQDLKTKFPKRRATQNELSVTKL